MTQRIKVTVCTIDPDDSEGAIVEIYSGAVLKRGFASAAGAASHLRAHTEKFERLARARASTGGGA